MSSPNLRAAGRIVSPSCPRISRTQAAGAAGIVGVALGEYFGSKANGFLGVIGSSGVASTAMPVFAVATPFVLALSVRLNVPRSYQESVAAFSVGLVSTFCLMQAVDTSSPDTHPYLRFATSFIAVGVGVFTAAWAVKAVSYDNP